MLSEMPDQLRIVRIIARLNIGGPARHVSVLDAGLSRRGYETVLLYGESGDSEGSLAQLVTEQNLPAYMISTLSRRVSIWNDIRTFFSIARHLFRIKPDVVHTHTAKAGIVGRLAATVFNITRSHGKRCLVVHTYHGNVFRGYFGSVINWLVRLAEWLIGFCTDYVVVISEQQFSEIVRELRIVPREKTKTIPLGLDLERFLAVSASSLSLREDLAISRTSLVLGFVGRLVMIKDLETLLRAFKVVQGEIKSAVLLIAGDGPVREKMMVLAQSLGISEAVIFLGWRHDLPILYRTMDIFLLSSRNEGTPVSVIEAMAAGLPVVATNVGGVPDLVNPGNSGLLVPAGDPVAMADAVFRLAGDTHARAAMGTEGRNIAKTRYTSDRLVQDIDRLYRDGVAAKCGVG